MLQWRTMRLELWVLFVVVPLCELSPALPSYDIWNDGAQIRGSRTDRVEKVESIESVKSVENVENEEIIESMEIVENAPIRNFTSGSYGRRGGKSLSMFNFFSFGEEHECKAQDGRRSGLCLNPYSCRRRSGISSGSCAHGFGVCCVFTVSCGKEITNNLTYFISPEFPSLSRSMGGCSLIVKKMDGASQLRLDFIHFNMGQPNRRTGECDSDVFTITGGNSKDFNICGQNSDQHIYYDLDKNVNRVLINLKMTRPNLQRFWEIKVMQVPFAQRAPAGCLQYFTTKKGYIQTLNYAENGRHLARQDYKSCVRQTRGMCSIAYEPCDARSFRIGQNAALETPGGINGGGLMGAGSPGNLGSPGNFGSPGNLGSPGNIGNVQMDTAMGDPSVETVEDDNFMGSGDGQIAASRISERQFTRWSPYAQHIGAANKNDQQLWRYWGYGNYGQGVSSFGRQRCQDRIITPCDGDEFLGTGSFSPGVCDPFHCGSTFCPNLPSGQLCRIETSIKPFAVGVKFGPPTAKLNPEDNIGVCLKYEQLPCLE